MPSFQIPEITATADDLFGDASDISSDEGGDGSKAGSDKGSDKGSDAGSGDERQRVRCLNYKRDLMKNNIFCQKEVISVLPITANSGVIHYPYDPYP